MTNAVILLVDDEVSILKSLKRTLFEYPYEIISAPSPREARKYLSEHIIDMIISDFKMPDESGFELLSFVRDKYPDIIRIMLSGYVEKDLILKSLFTCAALTFFPKPWDDTKLLNRITELLEIKQSIDNPYLWKIINSEKLFKINNNETHKLSLYRNNLKPDKEILKFVSDNSFLFFRVARMMSSDYFSDYSNFELAEALNTIGLDNLLNLCDNIPETSLSKTNVYLIMPEIFDIYYDSIYKLISGSAASEPLNTNLPFISLYNYLLYRTNRTEYLSRIERFISNGSKIDSRILVNNMFKEVLKLYKLPDVFYEKCEDIELDETYPLLAAKKLRDLVELFWWSDRMPRSHPLFTLPVEFLKKIYSDVKKLQL